VTDPDRGRDLLAGGIAAVLRTGTLAAIAAVGIGYLLLLVTGEDPGSPSLVHLIQGGGAPALVGLGMLTLTLLPAIVLGVAVAGFRALGERRMVLTAAIVLILLVIILATAAVIGLG
jgi:hypothetical protein